MAHDHHHAMDDETWAWRSGPGVSFLFGVRIRLGTILGRFSIIYFRGLGLRIRVWVRVWVGVSVVLWSW